MSQLNDLYLGIFSRAEQRVLRAIFKAITEGGGGQCAATLAMLARDSNTSRATTRNAINQAVAIGLLEKTERRLQWLLDAANESRPSDPTSTVRPLWTSWWLSKNATL
jgi:hypothetical protein